MTAPVAVSMSETVSLVCARASRLPSALRAASSTGAGLAMCPVTVGIAVVVLSTATVPSRLVTQARAPSGLTVMLVGELPTPVMVFTEL